jgi:rhamnose utilization protein RhaD (predicted bifunctional aldolase and dehydrogenase)
MHPVAVIALATAEDGQRLTREVYGGDVIWTAWQRPGFELGLELERIVREYPNAKGAILGQHGLINWADGDRECYELTLDLIRRAQAFLDVRPNDAPDFGGARVTPLDSGKREGVLVELLPWLRGKVSAEKRQIATVETRRRGRVREQCRRAAAGGSGNKLRSLPAYEDQAAHVDWNPQRDGVDVLRSKLETASTSIAATTPRTTRRKRHDSPRFAWRGPV